MKRREEEKNTARSYNLNASKYHASRVLGGKVTNEYIDIPTTLRLLPDLKGKSLLDIGCGSGINTQKYAEKGAENVLGIDISKEMISIAKKSTPKGTNINYKVGSMYSLPVDENTFDVVTSNYAMGYVKDLEKVFSEIARVLKHGGIAIVTDSHPFRTFSERQEGDIEEWVLKDYFTSSTRVSDIGKGIKVVKYKHRVSDYALAINKVGCYIDVLLEPQPELAGEYVDKVVFDIAMRLPQLIAFRIIKK